MSEEKENMLPPYLQQLVTAKSVRLLGTVFITKREFMRNGDGPAPADLESVVGALYGQLLLCTSVIEIIAAHLTNPLTGEPLDKSMEHIIDSADSLLVNYLLNAADIAEEEKTN